MFPWYGAIRYKDLYPGIDLKYCGAGSSMKSEFVVRPGADPRQIRLVYQGAEHISVDSDGALVVHAHGSELREQAPELFQERDGRKIPVKGRYRLLNARTVGFEVDAFDRFAPLIIDPLVFYSTYLGGTAQSAVTGLAVDSADDLYATGWTEAIDFPIVGSYQLANGGGVDAFVVKMNAAGTARLYATYIGGRGDDRGAGISVDSSGEA